MRNAKSTPTLSACVCNAESVGVLKVSSFSQSMDKYRAPWSVSLSVREREREKDRERVRKIDRVREREGGRDRCRIWLLYFIFNKNDGCLSTFELYSIKYL
jgi:hypothetical protein